MSCLITAARWALAIDAGNCFAKAAATRLAMAAGRGPAAGMNAWLAPLPAMISKVADPLAGARRPAGPGPAGTVTVFTVAPGGGANAKLDAAGVANESEV